MGLIFEIILRFLFVIVFYWTGEMVRAVFTLGKYQPDFGMKKDDESLKLLAGKSEIIGILFWTVCVGSFIAAVKYLS